MNPLPLLSPELEKSLVLDYRRTRDRRIEDRLVRSQLRLVAKLAHEYAPRRGDVDDLMQEGSLGLIQAIRRFDPDRGVRLSTYTAWWIRAYQLRWLVVNHRLVRVGTTAAQRRIFFNARSARRRLSAAGVDDSAALARHIGVGGDELEKTLRRIESREISLDQPVREGDEATRIEQLVDEETATDERVAAAELGGLVAREAARFRASLSGRDRTLFDARWTGATQPSLKSIGERLGVSRERARQLEERLLRKLRDRLPSDVAEAA